MLIPSFSAAGARPTPGSTLADGDILEQLREANREWKNAVGREGWPHVV